MPQRRGTRYKTESDPLHNPDCPFKWRILGVPQSLFARLSRLMAMVHPKSRDAKIKMPAQFSALG